jgi:hypothetical protein
MFLTASPPGRIIPTHIIIVVEMNMTIIAASLVVMRPCFQAIFDTLCPTSPYASHNTSSRNTSKYGRGRTSRSSGYIVSRDESGSTGAWRDESAVRHEAGLGIIKTVDIELASKDASTENILQGKWLTQYFLQSSSLTRAIENKLRNPLDRPEWHKQ